MKKYLAFISCGIAAIFIITACKKSNKYTAVPIPSNKGAYLKIVHVSPNFRTVRLAPDTFHVYVGGTKINGPFLTYNGAFPVNTANTDTYASVPAGDQHIRLSLVGKGVVDSLSVLDIATYLGPNIYYTLFITDSIKSGNGSAYLTQDNFARPDTGKYSVRFAHMVLADSAGKTVDVYSFRQATNIFANIAPGTVTPFITLPYYYSPTLDTISIRRSGTTNELARVNGISFTNNQRVYTIIYKGTPVTTGTKPRSAVVINNR